MIIFSPYSLPWVRDYMLSLKTICFFSSLKPIKVWSGCRVEPPFSQSECGLSTSQFGGFGWGSPEGVESSIQRDAKTTTDVALMQTDFGLPVRPAGFPLRSQIQASDRHHHTVLLLFHHVECWSHNQAPPDPLHLSGLCMFAVGSPACLLQTLFAGKLKTFPSAFQVWRF